MFIFHPHHNGICNRNIRSIQEIVRTSETSKEKFKQVCKYFPNLVILTNSATQGKVQLAFAHASVGNKYLGGSVTAFSLAGSLNSSSVISIDFNIAFSMDGNKIRLPISKIILCNATRNLPRSKKKRHWTSLNAVLLPTFLTEAAILDRKTSVEDILKTFTRTIPERVDGEEEDYGDKDHKEI